MSVIQSYELCCKHEWYEIESDLKGYPTKYKCVRCFMELHIPSRDKTARDYLKEKYKFR